MGDKLNLPTIGDHVTIDKTTYKVVARSWNFDRKKLIIIIKYIF